MNVYQQGKISHGNPWLCMCESCVNDINAGKLFILIYRELLGHTWFPEAKPEIMERLYEKLNDFGYETYLPTRRMVEYCDRIIFLDRFKS